MKINKQILIVALLITALGCGLFQVFLIPPFQNPDEIQHFLYSSTYAYTPQQMESVEKRLLELLKQNKWFHFVGIGPGWENIRDISEISFIFHFDPGKISTRNTLFHFLYGTVLKISGITDVLTAFYFLRLVSTIFYLMIFFLIFWFFRTYFPQKWEYYFIGFFLVFQLMTILNAVNYDVFMVLFGSIFFICAYRYFHFEKKFDLAMLLISAALAVFTKLAGIMFFVYIFILVGMKVTWDIKLIKKFLLVLLITVIGYCWLNYLFPERFFNLYSVIFKVLGDTGNTLTAAGKQALKLSLFDSMADSFYFHTGWMGFKLSGFWYLVLKIFLLLSVVGIFSGFFSKKKETLDFETKWTAYILIVCLLHTFSIWLYYGSKETVQGRYLYPIIIPIIILVYSGLHYLQERFKYKRDYILIVYIMFQVLLAVFAVTRIISVFYLEIASPHPGL